MAEQELKTRQQLQILAEQKHEGLIEQHANELKELEARVAEELQQ